MTLSITHTTPADGTFSTTGAAAWDATHSLGGVADISQGGTNATTAADARTSLGLGTIATQDANAVAITGGTINGTTVGATTVAAGSFSTLNSSGATRLGGASGNQSLQVNNVASAVNYIQTIGSVTNQPPTLSVQGTDAGIGFLISTKGIGGFGMYTGGGAQLAISHTASAVNYAQVTGAATGGNPTISAQGSDTNIGINIFGKGTGELYLGGSTTYPSLRVSTPASTVNSFQIYGNVTGQSPTLAALGPDTNIGINLLAKGTGTVILSSNGQQVFAASNASGTDFTNYYTTSGQLNYTAAGGSGNTSFYFGAKGTGSIQLASGGGTQAVVSNTASAVNYLNLTGAATGSAPTISAQGSDANINLNLAAKVNGYVYTSNANGTAARFFGGLNYFTFGGSGSGSPIVLSSTGSDTNIDLVLTGKGTGVVALGGSTVANSGFVVNPTASSVNYLQAGGGATGSSPAFLVNGTDTNIGLAFTAKGSSNITFQGFSFGQFILALKPTASAVNLVQIQSATTGNGPTISADGSDTNINLKLTPKGTGVLQFGTYTAGVLAQAGYITITDAGGTSRRLLVG